MKTSLSRLASNKRNGKKRRVHNYVQLFEYLKGKPCVSCGMVNPILMEFHHHENNKETNVVKILQKNTWEKALVEITKCQVLCSNCHRKITSETNNDYKNTTLF
jgi:hypothetical protein